MMKLLLTPEEAAESLSISRSKLYELLAAGDVESLRIGGSRRIPFDALEDFVDRHRVDASGWNGTDPLHPDDGDGTVVDLRRERKR
jgi:excisionase family DNA binding protein